MELTEEANVQIGPQLRREDYCCYRMKAQMKWSRGETLTELEFTCLTDCGHHECKNLTIREYNQRMRQISIS